MRFLVVLIVCLVILFVSGRFSEAVASGETGAVQYAIKVRLEPSGGTLEGTARITLPADRKRWEVDVTGLEAVEAVQSGRRLKPKRGILRARPGELKISYRAGFAARAGEVRTDPENPGVVEDNLISPEGVVLLGGWYPQVLGVPTARFSLKAVVPEGFEAVSEAEDISAGLADPEDGTVEFSFLFPYPVEHITLVAGPYNVYRAEAGDVDVYGYFFPGSDSLAGDYVKGAAEYIRMYATLFGSTPYSRFSVVENVLPTGYSMPTYTLLGSRVLRLPFILKTSLGHETLHQWFGSSVYVDYGGGNWAEGLTAYMAEHYYEEAGGRGAEHRKKLLMDYRAYSGQDTGALEGFAFRTDRASRSLGYGKGALVFHMLRMELGDDAFIGMLGGLAKQRFRMATWDDIQAQAEEASGRELDWFFEQWVERPGIIDLKITDVTDQYLDGGYKIRFVLEQDGPAYRFRLPVLVRTEGGGLVEETGEIKGPREVVVMDLPASPEELVLDKDYHLMRELADEEAAPRLSALLGARNRVVVTPSTGEDDIALYAPLVNTLEAMGFKVVSGGPGALAEIAGGGALVPATEVELLSLLFGRVPDTGKGGFALKVLANPLSERGAVAIVSARDGEEASAAVAKLRHYGQYTALAFEQGRNTRKVTEPGASGISIGLATSPAFVRTSQTLGFEDVIDEIARADVIYVGESHTNMGDHKLQLRVLKTLHERGHKVAVGMEMFGPGGQEGLDAYVRGETDEQEFLLDSKYFESWGMNFHLYREILDYARAGGIPVVALNQKKATVKKVAGGGLGSLGPEELEALPSRIDLTDMTYKRRLDAILGLHKEQPGLRSLTFFQAQVLRDEAMAENLVEFMAANPDHKVVVVVGQGHVAFGEGIPRRQKERNGRDYVILVNSDTGSVDPAMADFVFFAPEPSVPAFPAIGISVGKDSRGLLVRSIQSGGPAEKAGMRAGDIIIEAGGREHEDVGSLKATLFAHPEGQDFVVKVLRKRSFGKFKELELKIRLR